MDIDQYSAAGDDVEAASPIRAGIIAAAREVFIDRGYYDTRITDITKAAGIGAGSFYNHFDSKELVFAAMLDELDSAIMPSGWSPSSSVADWIEANARHYLQEFSAHAVFWRQVEQAALGNQEVGRMLATRRGLYVAHISQLIGVWADAGLVSPGTTSDAAALALVAMTEQCAYQWFVLDELRPQDAEALVAQLASVWCGAVRITAGDGTME